MKLTLQALRWQAVYTNFHGETTLRKAIHQLGFVQADPIRSPARAQDLILRHRVKNYYAGDLEKYYPKLKLEEDFLYAYGFMPVSTWQLLHPRTGNRLNATEKRIIEIVSNHKKIHPAELETYLGRKRTVNDWGGYSKLTTRLLQKLHYRGFLRIAGRKDGIRLYEPVISLPVATDPAERLKKLVMLIAGILAPLPEKSLQQTLRHLGHAAPGLEGRRSVVSALIKAGLLTAVRVEGLMYVWPAGRVLQKEPPDTVRFLAPFDPLVWDRRRFEHLWGWSYRFEAYTPAAKRKRGYYAMPLLWRDDIVGWVNISFFNETLKVEPGFINKTSADGLFKRSMEEEIARFQLFMKKKVVE